MKTFKTPIYKNLEFAFTTSTYSTTGNTYVGIHCKENDCIEPYCNLTVNLDMQALRCKYKFVFTCLRGKDERTDHARSAKTSGAYAIQ